MSVHGKEHLLDDIKSQTLNFEQAWALSNVLTRSANKNLADYLHNNADAMAAYCVVVSGFGEVLEKVWTSPNGMDSGDYNKAVNEANKVIAGVTLNSLRKIVDPYMISLSVYVDGEIKRRICVKDTIQAENFMRSISMLRHLTQNTDTPKV